jgi:hypothetical protein
VDDPDFDDLEPTYQVFEQRSPFSGLVLPVIVLLVVVAVISGLVWGGVLQGDENRMGPEQAPTTQVTVQIAP